MWGIIALVRPSQSLLAFTNVINNPLAQPQKLLHFRGDAHIDKPFDTNNISASFIIPFVRPGGELFYYTWRAALYITSKDNLPVWYQIDLVITVGGGVSKGAALTSGHNGFSITKVEALLPVVTWDGI